MKKMHMHMMKYDGKRLLAIPREGDYAHPGEKEAIEYTLQRFPKSSTRVVLDVGCGQGGTAEDIRNGGWGKVIGVDIENSSIEYAKKHYPQVNFFAADVTNLENVISDAPNMICLFNAFYAFPNQLEALKCMAHVAAENADVVIFDYLDYANCTAVDEEMDKFFAQIKEKKIRQMLSDSGWQIKELKYIDSEYHRWYSSLLRKLEEKKELIAENFKEKEYLHAFNTFSRLTKMLEEGILGGGIVYAKKQNSTESFL